jgi:hypothetical protein
LIRNQQMCEAHDESGGDMRIIISAITVAIVALVTEVQGASAQATATQDQKGKNCRMEQQCHWQDFKKICVWVKVCR